MYIFRSSQQVDMAGAILFYNILYVVRLECLLELSPGYEVLDLDREKMAFGSIRFDDDSVIRMR